MVVTRPSGETAGTPRVDPHGEQDRWLIGEGKNGFQELLRCQPTSRRESFEKGEHKTVFPTARENHPESRAGRPKELLCPLASGEERPGHNGVTTPLGVINAGTWSCGSGGSGEAAPWNVLSPKAHISNNHQPHRAKFTAVKAVRVGV